MKIVAWIRNEANEKALVNKIHKEFPISAIAMETRTGKRKITLPAIMEFGIEKLFLNKTRTAWWRMLKHYHLGYPEYPAVPILNVANINSDEVVQLTESIKPDLIIVSGTRLIKSKLLSLSPSIGILNLHTGLSPYVKGGPNCTNWCIANKQFHLIGNSIMWLDSGIDTGNLVYTERTKFEGTEDLYNIQLKVMEHAHDMYLSTIKYLVEGGRNSVSQASIGEGVTYFNKQWRLPKKVRLHRNINAFQKYFTKNKNGEGHSIITVGFSKSNNIN